MDELIATLARWVVLFQYPVHRPNSTEILAVIQQRGVDGGRCAILKTFGIQYSKYAFAFDGAQRTRRYGPGGRNRNRFLQKRSV